MVQLDEIIIDNNLSEEQTKKEEDEMENTKLGCFFLSIGVIITIGAILAMVILLN